MNFPRNRKRELCLIRGRSTTLFPRHRTRWINGFLELPLPLYSWGANNTGDIDRLECKTAFPALMTCEANSKEGPHSTYSRSNMTAVVLASVS